ncbi:PEP-CTERM sorting domain-containing protein, partial [Microcoleus sp. B13-B4]
SLLNVGGVALGGTDALGRSSLVIETVDAAEPVPEPTAIFGSALALGLGGWLKRKKSSQQHKTTSQG